MKIRLNFPIFMEEGEFLYNFLENIYFCYSIETKAAFDIFSISAGQVNPNGD